MVLLRYLFFIVLFIGCSKTPQSIIKENYYSPKNHKSLDKFTKVLKESRADEFNKNLSNSYEGLGLTLVKYNSKVYVLDVLKHSPAYRFGVQKGDILLKINDKDIADTSLEQIYREIKGAKNGANLTFHRKNESDFTLFLKRQRIKVVSTKYRFISKSELYIHIENFAKGTSSKVEKILKSHKEIKSITFDLRDNGGGIFEEALNLANLFIKSGILLYEKGKNIDKKYYATKKYIGKEYDIKIVVNHYTASASEIFAGIMQEYKKAVIVGETTYGKGSIQKVYKLNNGQIVKVTVSEYFLPSGKSINHTGLTPDYTNP